MPLLSLRSVFLLGLPLASIAHARTLPGIDAVSKEDGAKWRDEVDTVPEESLKSVVESNLESKYQEGVFEDGPHGAIAAVHSEDASLASKLVDLARQDAIVKDYLRRRQDSNTTIPAAPTTTSIVPETSTTVPASTEPTTESSSSAQGQSFTSSTTASSPTEESPPVDETSIVTQTVPSTVIIVPSTSSTPEVPVATTDSSDQPTTTSAPAPETTSETIPETTSETAAEPIPETTQPATTQTGVLVPIVTSATASDGSVVLTTTNAFETTAQTSIAIGITTTNADGQTMVTSSIAPATIITQTNSDGSTVVTTSPVPVVAVAPGGSIVASSVDVVTTTDSQGGTVVLSQPSIGATYTTQDSAGRIAIVTYTPGGGTVSQVRVQTTTLPNGQRSTITSFAEVGVETGSGSGSQASGTSGSDDEPGLQSAAVQPSAWFAAGFALIGGMVIGAGLLW